MTKEEVLIQRLREEATHELNHQTIALLLEAAQALASPAQPEPVAHRQGFWCADLTCKKCYSAEFRFKHTTLAAPVQPEHCDPSSSILGLAEMILSDCGCSSNYQPLLNRVAARIQGYIDTPPAAEQPAEPQGWKLVPVEPTEIMQDAGVVVMPTVDCHPYDAGMVYKAMLTAAPEKDQS